MHSSRLGAACLALAMTAAQGDDSPASPGIGWRPLTPPAYTPATTSTDDRSLPSQPPYSTGADYPPPGYPSVAPGTRAHDPYGTPYTPSYGDPYGGAYGGTLPPAGAAPYDHGYDGQYPYAMPYPPAEYSDAWGYPSVPGYYPAPDYGYAYPEQSVPVYPPYGASWDYGYPSGYDLEQGYAAPPPPGYVPEYHTPDHPGVAPGEYAPPPETWRPPGNDGSRSSPESPAAPRAGEYRVNGAPAVFRPWTKPEPGMVPEPN